MTVYLYPFADSSMLAECMYDDVTGELTITFLNGRSYTYVDVLKPTYDDLVSAPSPGRYFNSIKKDLKLK